MLSFEVAIGWRLPQFWRSFRGVQPLVQASCRPCQVRLVPGRLVLDLGGLVGSLLLRLFFLQR